MTKPLQRISKFGKDWQLIYGPLESTWEGQRVAATFERNKIECIEVEDPNGNKYLYRDNTGYVEIRKLYNKGYDHGTSPKSRIGMLNTKPKKSALRKMTEEFGDIQGMVKRALATA